LVTPLSKKEKGPCRDKNMSKDKIGTV